jgi:hypothetical protein
MADYEIQSRLRFDPGLAGTDGSWRAEYVKLDPDVQKAHYVNVVFHATNCDETRAQQIVDRILEALNRP